MGFMEEIGGDVELPSRGRWSWWSPRERGAPVRQLTHVKVSAILLIDFLIVALM